jgi:hypothetical protein
MRAEDGPPTVEQTTFTQDSAGQFSIHNISWTRQSIRIVGLPRTHYIQQIRYAGQPISDPVLSISSGGQLDIVIDDKPSAITGTVTNGGSDLGLEPTLVLLDRAQRRPGSRENEPFSYIGLVSPTGTFQFPGLAPGAYRVKVIAANDFTPRPSDLSADGGDLVSVGLGELKTIEIKLQ